MNANEISAVVYKLTGEKVLVSSYYTNVGIECPLAPYTHESGKNNRKSCSVKVTEDNNSPMYCWSCGFKGNFFQLANELEKHTGKDYKWFKNLVEQYETNTIDDLINWFSGDNSVADNSKGLDLSALDNYPLLSTYKNSYRKLSKETMDLWNLRVDVSEERFLFPVYDRNNTLVGITGRTYSNQKPKYQNYNKFSKGKYLYGEHMVSHRHLVIVEGQMDTIRVNQALRYENLDIDCIGIMGSKIGVNQRKKILDMADRVVIFLDKDSAGRGGSASLVEALSEFIPLHLVAYPYEGNDPDSLPDEEIIWQIKNAPEIIIGGL